MKVDTHFDTIFFFGDKKNNHRGIVTTYFKLYSKIYSKWVKGLNFLRTYKNTGKIKREFKNHIPGDKQVKRISAWSPTILIYSHRFEVSIG